MPISLLASITETSATSGPRARSSRAGSSRPSAPTGTRVSPEPPASSARAASSTEGCSNAETTIRRRPSRASASVPFSARLLASDPVAVNTISSGAAPISAATLARASSIASRAASPRPCTDDALPKRSSRNGRMASSTSGAGRVVAA